VLDRICWASSRALFPLLVLLLLLATFALFPIVRGQGLQVGGGYTQVTGNKGTDGFDVRGAWFFTKRVSIAADYDSAWDSTTLGTFTFTDIGAIGVDSHLQNVLLGPRIFFATKWTDKHRLKPFGEAQFGVSHLNQNVTLQNQRSVSASDTAFSWLLGGRVRLQAHLAPFGSRQSGLSADTFRQSKPEPFAAGARHRLHVPSTEPGQLLHRLPIACRPHLVPPTQLRCMRARVIAPPYGRMPTILATTRLRMPGLRPEEPLRAPGPQVRCDKIMKNLPTVTLAQNRRVDITLSSIGQQSVRQFPFKAEDALTLLSSESGAKPTAKKKT
jgi:hypothetical protein